MSKDEAEELKAFKKNAKRAYSLYCLLDTTDCTCVDSPHCEHCTVGESLYSLLYKMADAEND